MEKETNGLLKKTGVVCLIATICNCLWGSAFPSVKLGYAWCQIAAADTGSQILFAGCRFTLAGVLVLFFGSLIQKKILFPARAAVKPIFILAVFQTALQYLFFYVGMAHTTGVKGSIITSINVFLSILIASLFFHQEKLDAKKIAGCLLGFFGVVIVNLQSAAIDASFVWNGDGFIFVSATSAAISAVLIRKYSETNNPVMLSGCQFVLGGIALICCGAVLGGKVAFPDYKSYLILLHLALISAIAYTLWGILLKNNPVSKVTVYGFINPVAGVILSALLLGEKGAVTQMTAVALLLVSAGIFVVNRDWGK
ncbi:MAG: DMT family transporter [Clostridiaceae bacterium]|nr:DMT family transporter [Clostridiaceae bacterium]